MKISHMRKNIICCTWDCSIFAILGGITTLMLSLESCKKNALTFKNFEDRHNSDDIIINKIAKKMSVKTYEPILSFDSVEIDLEKEKSHYEYFYDNLGAIIETNLVSKSFNYPIEREVVSKGKIDYDEYNSLLGVTYYSKDGTIPERVVYTRDGAELTETLYRPKDSVNLKRSYTLDSDNCITSYKIHNYSSSKYSLYKVGEMTAYYNQECKDSKVVESLSQIDGQKTLFEYDKKNRLVKVNSSGSQFQYVEEFEYYDEDDKGNWCRKIRRMDGKPLDVTIREIQY